MILKQAENVPQLNESDNVTDSVDKTALDLWKTELTELITL